MLGVHTGADIDILNAMHTTHACKDVWLLKAKSIKRSLDAGLKALSSSVEDSNASRPHAITVTAKTGVGHRNAKPLRDHLSGYMYLMLGAFRVSFCCRR